MTRIVVISALLVAACGEAPYPAPAPEPAPAHIVEELDAGLCIDVAGMQAQFVALQARLDKDDTAVAALVVGRCP